MVANQSKHTVQFSDLAWMPGAPEFPRAWQVGQYLERYLKRYCSEAELKLGTRVETAKQVTSLGGDVRWQVQTKSEDGGMQETEFDYLVVASGYFGKAALPSLEGGNTDVPIIHSSAYRDLESLLSRADGRGGKILVVGGQMSGVEIAGTIASHLSSAVNSPGPSKIQYPEKYTLHHIIQRPIWVFPFHTSPKV
jgi:cation diffusion facilitator CzcD-associated flavoprotein CzcO